MNVYNGILHLFFDGLGGKNYKREGMKSIRIYKYAVGCYKNLRIRFANVGRPFEWGHIREMEGVFFYHWIILTIDLRAAKLNCLSNIYIYIYVNCINLMVVKIVLE